MLWHCPALLAVPLRATTPTSELLFLLRREARSSAGLRSGRRLRRRSDLKPALDNLSFLRTDQKVAPLWDTTEERRDHHTSQGMSSLKLDEQKMSGGPQAQTRSP